MARWLDEILELVRSVSGPMDNEEFKSFRQRNAVKILYHAGEQLGDVPNAWGFRASDIRDALGRLKIGSGGKMGIEPLGPRWNLLLEDTREGYRLGIEFDYKIKQVAIPNEEMITKGRSKWRRDNLWRIHPATLNKHSFGLWALMQNTPVTPKP